MPATSRAQRRLMAIAEHDPKAVYARNKGVLDMSKKQLHDFAATKEKKLPERKKPKAVVTVHPALVVRVTKLHPAQQVIRNHGTDND